MKASEVKMLERMLREVEIKRLIAERKLDLCTHSGGM